MIFVTGDVHGDYDIDKFRRKEFPEGKELKKTDYVICTGDFGLIWDVVPKKHSTEHYWLNWLDSMPWTTLFIDGNHENFDRLLALPTTTMFNGEVGIVNKSIYHLKRGEIYEIDGLKFFTFGGADSIDKLSRQPQISWWPQELASKEETDHALDKLEEHNYKVDYVLTHTAPKSIIKKIGYKNWAGNDPTTTFLEEINNTLKFRHWYFSHFHNEIVLDKYTCQYRSIKRIK